MEQFEINATVRKKTGNGPARDLRRGGRIPAVLYGPQTESVLLSVNVRELEQIIKKGNIGSAILNLVIQNGKKVTKTAMIKEFQSHPVSGQFLHIDFYEIDMQRKINVMIPITTKGNSKGIEAGGLLQIIRREIEVFCMPGDIPETFEIDVTDLDIGDSVHVDEIPLGDNIEIAGDVNFTVVTVLSPKVEAIPEEEEEEVLEGEEEAAEGEAAETAEPEEEK
ncbi:MAG: 50S ribosomal protein L25/general stress protein Ctc [Deltaproteobacteria bacterium]|nr:50S ribosomal protein L25/general stress protein Ctc [Deltaproteobacteria bacterium]